MPSIQMWWHICTHPPWKCASVDIRLSSISYAQMVPRKIACHTVCLASWPMIDLETLLFSFHFGHSHNMLSESWDYIMKHMTFQDKSSFWNIMKVHWCRLSLLALILLLPSCPECLCSLPNCYLVSRSILLQNSYDTRVQTLFSLYFPVFGLIC